MIADALGRPLRNLRLSVTDRCNLRCQYCMPEPDYVWLPREEWTTSMRNIKYFKPSGEPDAPFESYEAHL